MDEKGQLKQSLEEAKTPEAVKEVVEAAELLGHEDIVKLAQEKLTAIGAKAEAVETTTPAQTAQVESMGGSASEVETRTADVDQRIDAVKAETTAQIAEVQGEEVAGKEKMIPAEAEKTRVYENPADDPAIREVENNVTRITNQDVGQIQKGMWGGIAAKEASGMGYGGAWERNFYRVNMQQWNSFLSQYPEKAAAYREKFEPIKTAFEIQERRKDREQLEEQLERTRVKTIDDDPRFRDFMDNLQTGLNARVWEGVSREKSLTGQQYDAKAKIIREQMMRDFATQHPEVATQYGVEVAPVEQPQELATETVQEGLPKNETAEASERAKDETLEQLYKNKKRLESVRAKIKEIESQLDPLKLALSSLQSRSSEEFKKPDAELIKEMQTLGIDIDAENYSYFPAQLAFREKREVLEEEMDAEFGSRSDRMDFQAYEHNPGSREKKEELLNILNAEKFDETQLKSLIDDWNNEVERTKGHGIKGSEWIQRWQLESAGIDTKHGQLKVWFSNITDSIKFEFVPKSPAN